MSTENRGKKPLPVGPELPRTIAASAMPKRAFPADHVAAYPHPQKRVALPRCDADRLAALARVAATENSDRFAGALLLAPALSPARCCEHSALAPITATAQPTITYPRMGFASRCCNFQPRPATLASLSRRDAAATGRGALRLWNGHGGNFGHGWRRYFCAGFGKYGRSET